MTFCGVLGNNGNFAGENKFLWRMLNFSSRKYDDRMSGAFKYINEVKTLINILFIVYMYAYYFILFVLYKSRCNFRMKQNSTVNGPSSNGGGSGWRGGVLYINYCAQALVTFNVGQTFSLRFRGLNRNRWGVVRNLRRCTYL